jgi:hypothetical protein
MRIPSKAVAAVNELQVYLRNRGIVLSKEQTFKKLVEFNMMDRFGNPTQFAIENELFE